ncbi:hypothetical protein DRJ48_04125, partial [Candidatus Woesearchaeota archaeon]
MYGINDFYEFESDKRNPRKGSVEGAKLNPRRHSYIKHAALICASLIILSSLATLNPTNILGMAIMMFFSYFYSAPPLRLKTKPPLDSFSNGFIYVLGPVLMGFGFGKSILDVPLKGYLIVLGAMGVHAFSTIMDYTADKKAGDRTFAVTFGKRAAALFALTTLLVALIFGNFHTPAIRYFIITGCLFSFVS